MQPYTEKTGTLKKRTDVHAFEECGTLLHMTNVSYPSLKTLAYTCMRVSTFGKILHELRPRRSSAATVQVLRTDSYMQIL